MNILVKKLGNIDISNMVVRDSLNVSQTVINGLPEVWTEDLTLHDDIIGVRSVFSFSIDVADTETLSSILPLLYSNSVSLQVVDPERGEITVYCKPTFPGIKQELTRANGYTFWRLTNIVLSERSGRVV